MSSKRSKQTKRCDLEFPFTVDDDGLWLTPQKPLELGNSGRITRVVTRLSNATSPSLTGTAEVLVFNGPYHDVTSMNSAAVAAIPDEHKALHSTGITLTGSATTASEDLNVQSSAGGANYAALPKLDPLANGAEALGVSVKMPGTIASAGGTVLVTIYAQDCD